MASTILLLPVPLGPTTAVTPGSAEFSAIGEGFKALNNNALDQHRLLGFAQDVGGKDGTPSAREDEF